MRFFFALSLALAVLCSACASTRSRQEQNLSIPHAPLQTSKSEPKKFQKWNPVWWFGNIDDPEPPDWYRPGQPSRRWKWYCRNSLHNFTFYVIGIADKDSERWGFWPETNFNPEQGWNWAVCKHKWWTLPFLSYKRGGFQFYAGWRERGNFGCKLNFSSSRK